MKVWSVLLGTAILAMGLAGPVRAAGHPPNSCAIIANETDHMIKVTMETPTGYGGYHWDVYPHGTRADRGDRLAVQGRDVMSPTGDWLLHWTPERSGDDTWNYYANIDEGQGCNGYWVVTVQP